jgi:hypothetical protein
MNDIYYKVRKERRDYKGDRYFKFNSFSEKVVSVCVNPGEEKKGRTNAFGVYLIHRITFLSNYMAMDYIEPCTKKEYQKNFNKVFEMLK